jgi:hypothetical protein
MILGTGADFWDGACARKPLLSIDETGVGKTSAGNSWEK